MQTHRTALRDSLYSVQEGSLGEEDASIPHVPDLAARDQGWHQHPPLALHGDMPPCPYSKSAGFPQGLGEQCCEISGLPLVMYCTVLAGIWFLSMAVEAQLRLQSQRGHSQTCPRHIAEADPADWECSPLSLLARGEALEVHLQVNPAAPSWCLKLVKNPMIGPTIRPLRF